MKIIPIILSGGSGTRLWPLSRKNLSKQYLSLLDDNTLLQTTLLRLQGLDNLADPIIICNAEHRFLVAQQTKMIGVPATILLEPTGRNTAPAISAAALYAQNQNQNKDIILLVLPADHQIKHKKPFHQALSVAVKQAQKKQLLTFGIVPTHANTEYGYIKANTGNKQKNYYPVTAFVEKPTIAVAQQYLAQGGYFWNSGMFVFNAQTLLQQLHKYAKPLVDFASQSVNQASKDLDFIRLHPPSFAKCPNISIDCALLEKSDKVSVVPLAAGWSDVGSWSALFDSSPKDDNDNVIKGDIITIDTHHSYINAHQMVATIGVDNLIIINTPDATLIASKERVDEVKNIVEILKNNNKNQAHSHRKVYRPWGWYDSIEKGEFFQVKRLHINPSAKLSLQSHQQRAEHWIVVKGIATATNGAEILTLTKGQSTYIPIGVIHSLENQQSTPLEIIEVQSGVYLGEDDIKRFEDIYGR